MPDSDDRFLLRAAARARAEPGLLGAVLAAYAARAGLDAATLAAALGGTTAQVARLALCRPPRPERFRDDLEQIAVRVGLDPLPLARVLRLAGALESFADTAPRAEGLRAARRAAGPADDDPNDEEPR